jgi:quercetin dioxygenase-like cupin family protein
MSRGQSLGRVRTSHARPPGTRLASVPLRIESFKRPDWEPVPFEGATNVEGRVLFFDDTLGLALLRFAEHGNIHEHAGPNDTVVSCLEGRGFTKVGDEVALIESGQLVFWPAGIVHGLWTEESTMTTLMCERPASGGQQIVP